LCRGLNFDQLVSEPSHGPNILNLILTNNSQPISNTVIQTPIYNSDHASVAFDINIWPGTKIAEMFVRTSAIIHHTIELFVPLKPQKTNGVQLPLHLIRCNRKKNSAWAKAVSSDNQAHWDEYNKLRTTFGKKLSKFHNHVERKVIFSKNKNAFYRLLNSRLRKTKGLGVLLREDGIAVCKDRQSRDSGQRLRELGAAPSFPVMRDSLWFEKEEICKLLIRRPRSRSDTPDHVPLVIKR
ncbi:hypothetical protein COOONC_18046, partial [Cooperia oncophora]